ncbi:hypothetical protein GCM10007939_11670 [Amylibacter marinus]|uniref:Excalibur calcium-binding domain-containing protein n=1 Tax=Amylibacter marinus TaxID=1475483 RepID=A0ABQ5VU73_9RHOB|nr:hypothetical protein [Amylibacter marinus]GLQ34884.1 hypothetical protein GCM10007939_11670 [Amylibacter marinus]
MVVRYAPLLAMLGILVGCSSEEVGSRYFDSINPDPATVYAGGQRPEYTSVPAAQPRAESSNAQPSSVPDDLSNGSEYLDAVANGANADQTDPAQKKVVLNELAVAEPLVEEKKRTKRRAQNKVPEANAVATPIQKRDSGIDLLAYGRSQSHLVGTPKYARSANKYKNGGHCGQYSLPEIAQIAFLDAGGPRKDTLLLDRDGDGFACAWVPNR